MQGQPGLLAPTSSTVDTHAHYTYNTTRVSPRSRDLIGGVSTWHTLVWSLLMVGHHTESGSPRGSHSGAPEALPAESGRCCCCCWVFNMVVSTTTVAWWTMWGPDGCVLRLPEARLVPVVEREDCRC